MSNVHKGEIERGTVTFAHRSAPAWHSFANNVFNEDEDMTSAKMLKLAKLDNWNIRLEPVSSLIPADYRMAKDSFLVVRTNPFDQGTDVLATVGERYKEVQNEELFSFADNLLDGGATWESAGSIGNGRRVFGCLSIDRDVVVGDDKTKMYLVVSTSHDGSKAVQASITPVRVFCQNALNFALKSAKQSFKIRHTSTVEGKITMAREALGLTMKYADEFEKEAELLYSMAVTDKKFHKIIETLYPMPEADVKGALTKWENKTDLVKNLYFNSPTNENIKGTAWGVVNALTERLDYYRVARKGTNENLLAGASGFDPVVTAEKNRIVKQVLALAK